MNYQLPLDLNGWYDEDNNYRGYFTFTPSNAASLSPYEKTILSLFDTTGEWSRPYREAGYNVVCIDIQNIVAVDVCEIDIEWLIEYQLDMVHGVLVALPCTDFCGSGSRWWADKDINGQTQTSVDLAYHVLRIIEYLQPSWWVIENPVGRLPTLVPPLRQFGPQYFNPCEFGDPYTKKTGLWGEFNWDLKRTPVDPIEGSMAHKILPGPDQKYLRSITPPGFAKAFFEANP